VRRLLRVQVWALIGALLAAAGLPYFSAALGWAATQDGTWTTMRADIAVGVAVAILGAMILIVALAAGAWISLRRRQTSRRLAG
jgi:uncharacterized membrane protein